MKISTATTSSMATAVLLAVMTPAGEAFAPPSSLPLAAAPTNNSRRTSKTSTTTTTSTPRLNLLPESAFVTIAAVDPTNALEGLGQLALLGSIGLGAAFSNTQNKGEWKYEYKVGTNNELASGGGGDGSSSSNDLALLEVDDLTTVAQKQFFNKVEMKKEEPEPAVAVAVPKPIAPAEPAVVAAAVVKAPSKELLESAEKAKAEVQKVGMKETMEKMSSKAAAAAPTTFPVPPARTPTKKRDEETSTEVVVAADNNEKKPGAKRRFAKGMALILAAGGVALARNVVKAYLGRGML